MKRKKNDFAGFGLVMKFDMWLNDSLAWPVGYNPEWEEWDKLKEKKVEKLAVDLAAIEESRKLEDAPRLNFAFGTADYYNTDDEEKISRAIIKAARISEVRNLGREYIDESYVDIKKSNYWTKIASPRRRNAKVGLFYFTKDYNNLFVDAFPAGTPNSKFGYHKDLFRDLVKDGKLAGTDYEAYPRGFAFYDEENEVYVIVGGAWLNKKRGEAVCDIFKYPRERYPWTIFKSPIYTYRNMGS